MSTDDPFKTGGGIQDLGDALAATEDPLVGQSFGSYRIEALIAEGGMGRVYQAVRDDGQFDRTVAVKVLPSGMSGEYIKRFEQERQILASLSHPNIAQLYDAGLAESGSLYLVMELVDGSPVDRFSQERSLSVKARTRLMLQLAEALKFAHSKLVIHRDLKPSNVFVTQDGNVKLLDFGISKILESPDDVTAESRPMTPRYASPEQLLDEPISVASDVYQFGLLFLSLFENRRDVTDDSRASATERALKKTSVTTDSRLAEKLPAELSAIINQCLRADPAERYTSASELAQDVRNFLGGFPVSARNPGSLQKGLKFVKRNLPTVVAASVAFIAIVAGSIAYTVSINEARGVAVAERDEAERQTRIAEESLKFLTTVLNSANPNVAQRGDMTIREILDTAVGRIETELASQPEIQAKLYADLSNTYQNLGDYQTQRSLIDKAEGPTLEAHGPDSIEHFRLRLARGATFYQAGKYEEGKRYLEALIDQASSKLGEGHITTLRARTALANNLWGLGDMAGFAGVSTESLQHASQSLGPEDPFTLNAAHNVAIALVDQGRYDDAIELASSYAEIADDVLGEGHTTSLSLYSILASAYGYSGNLEGELEIRERIIKRQILARGEEHAAVGSAKVNLAYVYNDLEQYEDAERLFEEAADIWAKSLGAEHPTTLRGRRNLAVFQARHSLNPDALQMLEQVLEIQLSKLGPEHPNTIESQLHRAELLLRLGATDAEAEIAAIAELGDRVLGESHPIMQRFREAIAEVRQARQSQ